MVFACRKTGVISVSMEYRFDFIWICMHIFFICRPSLTNKCMCMCVCLCIHLFSSHNEVNFVLHSGTNTSPIANLKVKMLIAYYILFSVT